MTTTTLEESNAALRAAVRERLDATPADDHKMAGSPISGGAYVNIVTGEPLRHPSPPLTEPRHIVASTEETHRQRGDSVLSETYAEWEPPKYAEPTTAKFGTGAVRSASVEAFRYDLVSPIGLREVARACEEGAAKYGDWNWEKGMPVHDLLNHAIAHVYAFLSGDRNEPHLGHAAWNLLAAIHSHELWPHLNEGRLRAEGCQAPAKASNV
jgi:hypothetical protein